MVDAQQFAVLSFQPNFCDQLMFHGFFFTNENPRKFVEKQKMIFFYIFMFIWTPLRGRLPKERLPQKTFAQGEFLAKKFSPRRLLSKKDPLCQGDLFVQEDIYLLGTIVQRHLCNKEHPMAKYVVWSRVLTKQKSDTW